MWSALINGVDQGPGNSAAGYIRSPPTNGPLKDITASSMTCNVNNAPTAKTIKVKSGDKLGIQWHHASADASDDIIDVVRVQFVNLFPATAALTKSYQSHKGPVMVYIAPSASDGAGHVWVKLGEDGYSNGQWATDRLIANKGQQILTIPDLKAGNYLVRGEIIALHEADTSYASNPSRGAQFYMECVQIEVMSMGSTDLPTGVPLPGTYSYTDPGVVFDLYNKFTTYPIPGPPVWSGAGAYDLGSTPPPSSSSASSASGPATANLPGPTGFATVVSSAPNDGGAAAVQSFKGEGGAAVSNDFAGPPASSSSNSGSGSGSGGIYVWGQCGGSSWSGPTNCESGTTCQVQNPYYSQCLPDSGASPALPSTGGGGGGNAPGSVGQYSQW
ncbi:hypothetical protein MMC09_007078 [Bachmanniomyces sp. S44760]|nr:hypothetical protein [Bachmanniomyces sp. S44760]